MKPIVFNTVIDGKKYSFRVFSYADEPWKWWAEAYKNDRYANFATSVICEEQAILKLVKLLEK